MRSIYPFLFLALLSSFSAFAQAPQTVPYQAVARDAAGNLLVNQSVCVQFRVYNAASGGTLLYVEHNTATTNKLGLFTLNVGQGTPDVGATYSSLSGITWGSTPAYIEVGLDLTNTCSGYVTMGRTQMMSVPYALYAGSAGSAGGTAGGDLTGTYPNPTLAAVGTAGIYGSGSTYPVVTVDSKGRVTGVTTDALPTSLPPSGTAGGDLTGTYPSPTLAAVGTAGTYTKVTTDSKGRVISGTILSASDVPSGSGNYIQNTSAQQSSSNFNISGNGAIGGNSTIAGTQTVTGLVTQNGGLTETGTANINTTGTAATNIGTSSNTGAVAIGNSTGGVNIKPLTTAGIVTNNSAGLLSTATLSGLTYSGNTLSTNNNGTVTSITAGTGLTGGTITGTGTIALSTPVSVANGGSGLSSAPSNGQLLIGNGTNYTLGTIAGGTNVTVTNSAGGISIAAAGSGISGSGTANYLARWTGASALSTGTTYDNGTNVGIGTTSPAYVLDVNGPSAGQASIGLTSGTSSTGTSSAQVIQFNSWYGTTPAKTTSEMVYDFYGSYYSNASHGVSIKSGRSGLDNIWFRNATNGIMAGFMNTTYTGAPTLVNTDNFLVGGSVGVGTTAPYTNLDVVGSIYTSLHASTNEHAASEQGTSYIGHKSGNTSDGFAGMGIYVYPGTNGINNAGIIQFYTWGNSVAGSREVARINEHGYLGIGTPSPSAPIDVEASTGIASSGYAYGLSGSSYGPNEGYNSTYNISIRANYDVLAGSFLAYSDARIKNIIGQSNTSEDLQKLLRVRITNYTMRDEIKHGNAPIKKVIAQQVKEVYPQAVKMSPLPQFIPNVYQNATGYQISGKDVAIYLSKAVSDTNVRVGGKCKFYLYDTNGKEIEQKGILSALSGSEIHITTDSALNCNNYNAKAFVFGTEINDLLTVDYEALSMLNISATQELAKKLDEANSKIEQLKNENAQLKSAKADASDVTQLKLQLEELKQLMEKNGIRSEK